MDDYFIFKEFMFFFKRGHGSHVALEAIEQAQKFGLDMIILPLHTSNAFQPLIVACFKPFKTIFKKERNIAMVRRNYTKPNKIALARWVDKTLTKQNIMLGFKGIGIYPLNLRAMDSKIGLSTLYTLLNRAREEEEPKQEDGEEE